MSPRVSNMPMIARISSRDRSRLPTARVHAATAIGGLDNDLLDRVPEVRPEKKSTLLLANGLSTQVPFSSIFVEHGLHG